MPASYGSRGRAVVQKQTPFSMNGVCLFCIAAWLFSLSAIAADVHKCVDNGRVTYTDAPCPDQAPARAARPDKLDLGRLSPYQADMAHDCIEAANAVNKPISGVPLAKLPEAERNLISAGFQKHCTAYGFKTPLVVGNATFNDRRAKLLMVTLQKSGFPQTSFGRVYAEGVRIPRLFESPAPAENSTATVSEAWPELRSGLWQFSESENGEQKESTTECVNPVEILRWTVESMVEGCGRTVLAKTGNKYTTEIQCEGKGAQALSGTFGITRHSADRFSSQFNGQHRGKSMSFVLAGNRISDCNVPDPSGNAVIFRDPSEGVKEVSGQAISR
jgi:hypothetical protein